MKQRLVSYLCPGKNHKSNFYNLCACPRLRGPSTRTMKVSYFPPGSVRHQVAGGLRTPSIPKENLVISGHYQLPKTTVSKGGGGWWGCLDSAAGFVHQAPSFLTFPQFALLVAMSHCCNKFKNASWYHQGMPVRPGEHTNDCLVSDFGTPAAS